MDFGDTKIGFVMQTDLFDGLTAYELFVSREGVEEPRTVKIYHYKNWEDNTSPKTACYDEICQLL